VGIVPTGGEGIVPTGGADYTNFGGGDSTVQPFADSNKLRGGDCTRKAASVWTERGCGLYNPEFRDSSKRAFL
jgi:hypothetical protein